MRQSEAQRVADHLARKMGAHPPRVRLGQVPRGWSGRYYPREGTVRVRYSRGEDPGLKKTLLSHELAHWASRVVYCDRSGRSKTCTYRGQHNPAFYRVLSEVHRELGIPKDKALRLESRAGYRPPDGWMSDQAQSSGLPPLRRGGGSREGRGSQNDAAATNATRGRGRRGSVKPKLPKPHFLARLLQAADPRSPR